MNSPTAIQNASRIRRILIRGVNWLGDAVMTTPALMRLRERFPAAHITILAPEKLRDLWLHHPAVNERISFAPHEGLFAVSRKLRQGSFDFALVLPNSPRSAIETWLARIPMRIGYARRWRNFLLTTAVPASPRAVKMHKRSDAEVQRLVTENPVLPTSVPAELGAAHQVNDYLHLVAALGANAAPLPPQIVVAEEELNFVRNKFRLADSTQPIFGLNPGAEYGPAKRWPVEQFIAAARGVRERTNAVWLIFGGPADLPLAGQIHSSLATSPSASHNLAGKTSLRELCALLKLCRVVLTNDTGPMHVAAAVGTPVVVPFGSTSPELTGPGLRGDPHHSLLQSTAPCSPCFLRECPIDFRCMKGISVDAVVAAVLKAARK